MPKYEVGIDLSGTWSAEIRAESIQEAAQKAVDQFEKAYVEDIIACIDPVHPDIGDVEIYGVEVK